jgi:hypothetical protein
MANQPRESARAQAPRDVSGDLFRQEALQTHARGEHRQGELLRISPSWTRWTFWLLLGFASLAAIYLSLGSISEYAEGPAVVQVEGGKDLFAIALLPGSYRPQLRPGMPLRLELAGYRHAFEPMTIDSIGDQVIGPQEARRLLGQENADTPLPGSVVVVRARLPAASFVSDDPVHALHDGVHGHAEVRVRSERILLALFPVLKPLLERHGG